VEAVLQDFGLADSLVAVARHIAVSVAWLALPWGNAAAGMVS
jgi:hypothetical protein